MQDKKQILISVGYIAVIIIIILAFAYFNKAETPVLTDDANIISTSTTNTATTTATSTVAVINTSDSPMDAFAKCTAKAGLTMYGAAWCSHCAAQKKLFGESFKYVNYVECPDNIQLCTDKGINGYPTWIDGAGKKYEGEQELSGIAKISVCKLP